MTHHSDEPTIGLDDATAHFVTLETYHQLDKSLAAHQPDTVRQLTFGDLLAAATNPDTHAETIAKIGSNAKQASRFAALLRSMAIYTQPSQAAAASGAGVHCSGGLLPDRRSVVAYRDEQAPPT